MQITSSIGFKLAKVLRLKRRFIDERAKPLGLSRTQWQVLFWMKELGPCSQKFLVKKLEIDKGHLARILNQFEKDSVVTRKPDKQDRRVLLVNLTNKAEKKYIAHLEKILDEENEILTQGLNKKEEMALKKLLTNMEINMKAALIRSQEGI